MILMTVHARTGPVAVAGREKMLAKVPWLLGEVSLYTMDAHTVATARDTGRAVQYHNVDLLRNTRVCASMLGLCDAQNRNAYE